MKTIRGTIQGFPFVGLTNGNVEIRVLPGLGAKIFSLVNKQTGREWMWSPPGGPKLRVPVAGSSFSDGSLTGADECIPTIAPCVWRGLTLPDHGEAWSISWNLNVQALNDNRIVTWVNLPISPLRIERCVTLTGCTVKIDYQLENLSDDPFEFLWAFHPLLRIMTGDRIELPPMCQEVQRAFSLGCPWDMGKPLLKWPNPPAQLRLDLLELGEQDAAIKLFTPPFSTKTATIHNANTGDLLSFNLETHELNTFGIWINRGGWHGYHHAALEPTNGAPDGLDVAVNKWKQFDCVAPNGARRWDFKMRLGPS